MPSQLLAWNVATQPSPTLCARFPNSPLAAGCGHTTRLPPSAKAHKRTRAARSSRPSSHSTGRAPTKSSQLAPVHPLTPRTAPVLALSSYIWICPPTCPAQMLAGACGTTLQALCQPPRPWRHAEVFASGVDAICAQQILQVIPPVPRTTLLKITFRLLFNDSKWRRSPDTHRFAVEVGSSR